jgi:hypothetical protein
MGSQLASILSRCSSGRDQSEVREVGKVTASLEEVYVKLDFPSKKSQRSLLDKRTNPAALL